MRFTSRKHYDPPRASAMAGVCPPHLERRGSPWPHRASEVRNGYSKGLRVMPGQDGCDGHQSAPWLISGGPAWAPQAAAEPHSGCLELPPSSLSPTWREALASQLEMGGQDCLRWVTSKMPPAPTFKRERRAEAWGAPPSGSSPVTCVALAWRGCVCMRARHPRSLFFTLHSVPSAHQDCQWGGPREEGSCFQLVQEPLLLLLISVLFVF